MKITIIGNSVALRLRPIVEYGHEKNYTQLLQERGFQVESLAKGAMTVLEAPHEIDLYIHSFPNAFVLNFGVVDCCSREIPLWFYRLATCNRQDYVSKLCSFLYNYCIKKIRTPLVFLRAKKPWVSEKQFEQCLDFTVKRISKETDAFIILIGINPTEPRIEKILPGSTLRNCKYDSIIRKIAARHNANFINVSDMKSQKHYPDGVHYNHKGHQIFANKILKELERNSSKQSLNILKAKL